MRYDYLIVGQGLAGSAMAIHLLKRRRKFLLIDQPSKNMSSIIAAGIYNPITGKNWVKTWMADKIFPYMYKFYRDLEQMSGIRILVDKLIYKPFTVINEQNDWMGRSEDPLYSAYIQDVRTSTVDNDIVHNPYGGLEIRGGNLLIPVYLNSVMELLKEVSCYSEEHFNLKEVTIDIEKCIYRNNEFGKIIFCQGPQSAMLKSSDSWNFLPFRHVKGEILTVNVKKKLNKIYNKGSFILPTGNGSIRLGATYDHSRLDTLPTEKGKMQLIDKTKAFFKPAFEVIDQQAGIRPATIDRKPFLGMHPNDKKLVIFNGLGAKGVTLAPFFANHLLEHLENDSYLLKEVDINRFIK